MKRLPPRRCAAILAVGCALLSSSTRPSLAQEENSPTAILLSRARILEQRGRLDLAQQDWTQVLTLDPNDAQALAGLVRAARVQGHPAEAAQYLARLRSAHPKDPELARLDQGDKTTDVTRELAEAERLAHAGDSRGAFAVYRRIYGFTPPVGPPAIAYYQAEAGTEDGRPQAIAGLRALNDRYPADSRYALALGRVLLASPRTQSEGRTLLERYPANAEAVEALHAGDSSSKAGSESARNPGLNKPVGAPSAAAGNKPVPKPSPAVPLSPPALERSRPPAIALASKPEGQTVRSTGTQAFPARHQASALQEQAGFSALNQHRTAEAEQIFNDLLQKDPLDARASAGLGYVREQAGDFDAAVRLFEKAQESGDRSLALTRALVNAQFEQTLRRAAAARQSGDLAEAEVRYRIALQERPGDPEALEGFGSLLLQTGRAQEASPVFQKLTQVRPMSPAAWRGLVISLASAGKSEGALAADARIPAEARAPLQQDASYGQALETAHARTGPSPQLATGSGSSQPLSRPAPITNQVAAAAPPPSFPPAQARSVPPPSQAAKAQVPPSSPSTAASAGEIRARSSAAVAPPSATATASTPKAAQTKAASTIAKGVAKPVPATNKSSAVLAQAAPPIPSPSSAVSRPQPADPARTIAAEKMAQAKAALLRSDYAQAADLYAEVIQREPNLTDPQRGHIEALHSARRDAEALTALEQLPQPVRPVLDQDATFQVTVGAIFLSGSRPNEALHALARAQSIFAEQKLQPPLELVLQVTRLLASRDDEHNLYRELAYLGDRQDLSRAQRREVQLIWANWATHRARVLAAAGERQRAVTLLNAVVAGFAGNPEILNLVAQGYADVGLPREAVALYKQRDVTSADAHELEAAIQAATAAHDWKAAEGWARVGRERFQNDSAMLTTIAELEQARGHEQRAVELSRQAKSLATNQDPGQVLTAELREAGAGHGWPVAGRGTLSVLLSPDEASASMHASEADRPYLPSITDPGVHRAGLAEVPSLAGMDDPAH